MALVNAKHNPRHKIGSNFFASMLRVSRNRASPAAFSRAQAAPLGVKPAAAIEPNPLVVKGGRPVNLRKQPCLGVYKRVDDEWHLRTDDQYVRAFKVVIGLCGIFAFPRVTVDRLTVIPRVSEAPFARRMTGRAT